MSFSPRRRSAMLAAGIGLAGLLTVSSSATAAPADTCADGVTVVVDFTDVGGAVEVGCADGDPASGREALESAGFTPTDSVPGMICAIDARPEPCPEEFDGSFWSYWTTDGGEWVSHTAGADGVDPAPGDIEGWRYDDGATGPGLSPDEAAASAGSAPADARTPVEDPVDGDEPADADAATDVPDTAEAVESQNSSNAAVLWFVVAGIAVAGAVVAFLMRTRRR